MVVNLLGKEDPLLFCLLTLGRLVEALIISLKTQRQGLYFGLGRTGRACR